MKGDKPTALDVNTHEIRVSDPLCVDPRTVLNGTIIVVRRGLQRLGVQRLIEDAILDSVKSVTSAKTAARVRARGLNHIHSEVGAKALKAILLKSSEILKPYSARLLREIQDNLLASDAVYYGPEQTWVRMMAPANFTDDADKDFAGYPGHLIVHHPHRDSWFSHCHNSINFWAAVGPVKTGNGLLVFPDVYRQPVHHKDLSVESNQKVGRYMAWDLEPGDVVCFAGEHLHSSALNVTDETRVAITVRLSVGSPRYGTGRSWIPYLRVPRRAGKDGLHFGLRARLTRAYIRHLWRRLTSHRSPPVGGRQPQSLMVTKAQLASEMAEIARTIIAGETSPQSPKEFEEIASMIGMQMLSADLDPVLQAIGFHPLSQRSILVNSNTKSHVVARHCPHLGADLEASGILADGEVIHCAWHAVKFSLSDGRANSSTVPSLTIRPSKRFGTKLYWLEEPSDHEEGA